MSSTICEMLNIKYPIIQGAMAWIADSSLTAAVSKCWRTGHYSMGNAPADYVKRKK